MNRLEKDIQTILDDGGKVEKLNNNKFKISLPSKKKIKKGKKEIFTWFVFKEVDANELSVISCECMSYN